MLVSIAGFTLIQSVKRICLLITGEPATGCWNPIPATAERALVRSYPEQVHSGQEGAFEVSPPPTLPLPSRSDTMGARPTQLT